MVSLSWLFGYPTSVPDGSKKPPSTTAPTPAATTPPVAASPPPPIHQEPSPAAHQQQQPNHLLSQRSLRQLGLFFGGAGFFYWSLLLSRRAITRHQLAARLKFYQPSNQHLFRPTNKNGEPPKRDPLVAVEALNLATLNTLSFAMAAVGGVAWAFDISSLEDLRKITRRSIEEASGQIDEAAEREVVEWVTKTFGIEERKWGDEGQGEGEKGS